MWYTFSALYPNWPRYLVSNRSRSTISPPKQAPMQAFGIQQYVFLITHCISYQSGQIKSWAIINATPITKNSLHESPLAANPSWHRLDRKLHRGETRPSRLLRSLAILAAAAN
jgi:hypothetical protein